VTNGPRLVGRNAPRSACVRATYPPVDVLLAVAGNALWAGRRFVHNPALLGPIHRCGRANGWYVGHAPPWSPEVVGMRASDGLGQYGENVAVRHLAAAGMAILDRNWRCPAGEIDIVARDGHTLVICEVKTRSAGAFGDPIEAVTPAKAARLRRLAAMWLDATGVRVPHVRVDVVGVRRGRTGAASVEHLRGVL
jgi:putative endonuclease